MEYTKIDYTGIDQTTQDILSKFKPHYQEWGVKEINKGKNPNDVINAIEYYIDNINNIHFKQALNKITTEPKNILTISLDQIKNLQQQDTKLNDTKLNEIDNSETKQRLCRKYTTILANKQNLKIIKIESNSNIDEAARTLSAAARNTKWCVANPKTGAYYLDKGPLFVIIIDSYKLLCHIETCQLMNENNQPIKLGKSSYEKLYKFIPNIGLFYYDVGSPIYIDAIKNHPRLAFEYSRDVIKGRWPEAESTIMKDTVATFNYARDVIKGRWPEAEPSIIKCGAWASYWYARFVIKGPWPEAEPTIMQNETTKLHYISDILKTQP